MPKTRTANLCYVYCAVEGQPTTLPAAGMPDGAPPRLVILDDTVAIVVSDVPAVAYASEALEPRLADLDWVSAAGAAHHLVVDALTAAGHVVVPFRLFTLYSSETKALETLRDSRAALTRVFDRVRGKEEWVLRVAGPDPARIETVTPAPPSPASGTNFLQAKANAKREAAARATRVREDTAAAYEALEQLADAARTRPVDGSGNLLLDAAFLVPPSRVDAMRDALTRRAERLLRDGCAVSLTGPWPPYSFAAMDASHA